jgi:hypothetical protein
VAGQLDAPAGQAGEGGRQEAGFWTEQAPWDWLAAHMAALLDTLSASTAMQASAHSGSLPHPNRHQQHSSVLT